MQPIGRLVTLRMHVWKGDSVDTNMMLLHTLHSLLAVVAQSLEMGDYEVCIYEHLGRHCNRFEGCVTRADYPRLPSQL